MTDSTQSSGTGSRKTHPLIIVAAGAVTLFCLVGIGVMTGIIPGAQSGTAPKQDTVAVLPMSAGAAQAPIASVTEAALPQSAPSDSNGAPSTSLPPIRSETLGQPNAKLDAKAASAAPAPAVQSLPSRANQGASGQPAGSGSAFATAPTPVYAASGDARSTPSGNAAVFPQETALPASKPAPPPICRQCGTVEQITALRQEGQASGTGAVLGGLIGGVVGHQVGSGRGKDVATVAGAVGGALLGNQIEKSSNGQAGFEVRVRMEDNTYRTAKFEGEPGLRIGDRVRFDGGRLVRR